MLLLPETMLTKLNQTVKSCGVKEKLNELKDPKTRHRAERNDRVGDNSHWVCHVERYFFLYFHFYFIDFNISSLLGYNMKKTWF